MFIIIKLEDVPDGGIFSFTLTVEKDIKPRKFVKIKSIQILNKTFNCINPDGELIYKDTEQEVIYKVI